jgi:hypothetical protein
MEKCGRVIQIMIYYKLNSDFKIFIIFSLKKEKHVIF